MFSRSESRFFRTLVLCSTLPGLGACAAKSISLAPVAAGTEPVSGAPYVLMFDQFPMKVNYELVACGKEPRLKITATSGDPVGAVDPMHIYALDLESLAGPFRTHDISLEYNPDLGVKTLNGKAEDRTAEAVGKLAETAAGIAKVAIAAAGAAPASSELCSAKTLDALKAVKASEAVVKAALAEQKKRQGRFDRLKARIDAQAGVAGKVLAKDFANSYRALQAATDAVNSAKAAYDDARGDITFTREANWPDNGNTDGETIDFAAGIAVKTFDRWLTVPSTSLDLTGQYDVLVTLVPTVPNALTVKGSGTLDASVLARGVPYRVAMPARLEVSLPNNIEAGKVSPKTLLKKEAPVRQIGRIMLLPCKSRPFTAMSCSLAFDEKGRLSKIGNANSKAQGEAVAGLLAGGVTQATSVQTALQAAKDKRDGAEKVQQEDKLAKLELQKKIADAQAALVKAPATELDAWNREILENQVELQLLQSRKALDDARALAGG